MLVKHTERRIDLIFSCKIQCLISIMTAASGTFISTAVLRMRIIYKNEHLRTSKNIQVKQKNW